MSNKDKSVKKIKKVKASEINGEVDEIFNTKSKRKLSEDEEPEINIKSSSEEPKHKKKKHDPEEEEDEAIPRRRTRSLSNADEEYPVGISTEDFHKEHQISIKGSGLNGGSYECPAPLTSFASTPFSPVIRKALDAAGYANPTPTQAQAWPIALSGRDVITVAKTGSGMLNPCLLLDR